MAEYTLPDLDWDYAALEPHISGQINEIHHSKHHATYVKGANDALAKLEEARAKGDHSAIFLNETWLRWTAYPAQLELALVSASAAGANTSAPRIARAVAVGRLVMLAARARRIPAGDRR